MALRLVGEAWAIAALLQLVLWGVQQRTKNAGIVDVGWALSFAVMIGWFGWRTSTWPAIGIAAAVWSLRLGGYLIARGAASAPEEGRYKDLRARWAPHAARNFFVFFQAQAALAGLLSAAFALPFVAAPTADLPRTLGLAITVIGILGEAIADWQLARWKRSHRGQVCDAGLWRYSRHPNYFFEWCVWVGYAIYGLAYAPWGLIALVPQAIILGSIFGVTGIPPTEAQALRSKGEAYAEYQRRVSRFVPMPPKRA